MRTILKAALFLISISFIISCSSSENENSGEMKAQSSDEFISYKLNEGVPKVKWADLIEKIEITRLEETEESLLSYVRDVYVTDQDEVVFISGSESNIYTFSPTGELVFSMNRKGEGPEEYGGIQDFWLEGDTVAIYYRGKYIKRYSLEGNFISSTDMHYQAGHMLRYSDGFALDMFFSAVDDTLFCNVLTLNREMQRGDLLLQSEQPKGFNIFTSNNSLARYKRSFLYQRVMSDTVYIYSDEQMKPMIHFDFGQDWYFRDRDNINGEGLGNMFDSEKFWNQSSKISPDYAYVAGWRGKGDQRKFVIDRVWNKMVEIVNSTVEEEKYDLYVSHWVENGMMGSMNSLEVANLLSELEEGQWTFTEGTSLDIIESSENPVLVKVRFKESADW